MNQQEMVNTIERMRKAGKKYQQRCKELYRKNWKLLDEVGEANEEIMRLEEENKRLKRRIADLERNKDQ